MRRRSTRSAVTVSLAITVALVCSSIGASVQNSVAIGPPGSGRVFFVQGSTKRVSQLTGDFDRALQTPTLSQTTKRFGIVGTDLGSSFEHKGDLYFLFGDTIGQPGALDAIGWTSSRNPEKIVLDFHRGRGNRWIPPSVPGIRQGGLEVPSGGISIEGTMFVVFTTDHTEVKKMGRSVMASSKDDGRTFKVLYELSRDKFINVSFVSQDGWLYLYGSGDYRNSSVSLARVKPSEIGVRSSLEYFGGSAPNGQARWSSREADAVTLFDHNVVGELSVTYLAPLAQYVMLYNSREPRGIVMRSSSLPTGSWLPGGVLFDPRRDQGDRPFMYMPGQSGGGDKVGDPNRRDQPGGEYGPFIMERYTNCTGDRCRLYYTMSTWNPYQVMVMQSDVRRGPSPRTDLRRDRVPVRLFQKPAYVSAF